MTKRRERIAAPSRAERAYAALLWLYPGAFREEYGGEMCAAFGARWAEARRTGGSFEPARLALAVAADAVATALGEHLHLIAQDLRQAARSLAQRGNRPFTVAPCPIERRSGWSTSPRPTRRTTCPGSRSRRPTS